MMLNATHDPARSSWVESANRAETDFPVQNLPHGVFSTEDRIPRGGVAIGDKILDLQAVIDRGVVPEPVLPVALAAAQPELNNLLSMGNAAASALRAALFDMLAADGGLRSAIEGCAQEVLVDAAVATLHMPVRVGSFTDFMTSVFHVSAPRRARPARPLSDNFLHLPVGYNSRASSVTPDGVNFERPWGQRREASGEVVFAPTASLDFELEFGALVGRGNGLGEPVSIDDSGEHIFGYVIVNDWSARDIQLWESRLGPFLGKSFRTTISPWIVTAEAMAPFRCPAPARAPGEPQPLPYLDSDSHRAAGALDVRLEAHLTTQAMRNRACTAARIVKTDLLHCSWTFPQMLAHHTSNGCNLQPGDLLSSGTVSGPSEDSAACMLEITNGILPIDLPGGEQRLWLEDGDELTLTARAQRDGRVSIGFGPCGARVLPARA